MRALILTALSVSLLGCFSSKPPRCDATKTCFAADALGCCDGRGTEVSVCDGCPSGMIERTECRVSGCDDPCDVPLDCRQDLGDDCCGAPVFSESCDVCPRGSRPASECAAGFIPTCGCAETVDSDAGGPPFDGGAGRPADDADIAEPPSACFQDLGEGCCGGYVGEPTTCGCPMGSTHEYECTSFVAGDAIVPPMEVCRAVISEGCCGGIVERNACTFECPAGSVPESVCGEINDSGGGAEPPDDEARPAPIPCWEIDESGCCGAEVAPSSCTGLCPPGTSSECLFC